MSSAPRIPIKQELPSRAADELPNGWRWVVLGDVVESMKNGVYKPASAYAENGLACLRMYNIDQGRIDWRDIKRMRLSEEETKDYELLPGDLLVNRVNSRELVGKSAVTDSNGASLRAKTSAFVCEST